MPEVLSREGLPIVSDFAGGGGTPLVVNTDTGSGFVLVNNAVVRLNGMGVFNVLDYATVQECVDAAGSNIVVFPSGSISMPAATIALTAAHNGQVWIGYGATLTKGFNGTLVTVSNTSKFSIHGLTLNGNHGTYTGKGLVISGLSESLHIGSDVIFEAFTDSHIEFGVSAGLYAKVLCTFKPGSGQTDYRAIHVNGTDTDAVHRRFEITAGFGYIDLDGALSTLITGIFRRVEVSSACAVTGIYGATWGNFGQAITISGDASIIIGNRISGSVTLDANFSGSFMGNVQTDGTFTNSAIGGNALVFHKDTATGTIILGKNTTYGFPSATERIPSSRTASVPDADLTATVGGTAPVIIFANALAADRAVTLSTTGAVAGDRFRIVRSGAGAFNLNVGGLKTLAASQWCDVEFDSSAWVKTAFGSL